VTEHSPAKIDPAARSRLRILFQRHGFRPRRRFGQTFLVDANIVQKAIRALNLTGEECVVEVGAGAGAVTRALAEQARRVIAIEVDPALVTILGETVGDAAEIVHGDALALEWDDLLRGETRGRCRLIANLPYAITGPAIIHLLDGIEWFDQLVIMVQEEVAGRLLAPAGRRARGLLTVLVEAACDIRMVGRVTRTCFLPQPKVDSTILALNPRRPGLVPPALEQTFRRLVKAAFGTRRKTLSNALSHSPALDLPKEDAVALLSQCDIDPGLRAEDLSAQEFVRLAEAFAAEPRRDPS
jgi:16S rRNA (adenine1518-N6/adenine1519-N6)-dimethyltransferase